MKTRDKLTKKMNEADISGFQQCLALILFDAHGLSGAMEYVNQITIDKTLGVCE